MFAASALLIAVVMCVVSCLLSNSMRSSYTEAWRLNYQCSSGALRHQVNMVNMLKIVGNKVELMLILAQ